MNTSFLPPETSLRAWQQEAQLAWQSAGRRGVIAAATGTGKTTLALSCAESLPQDDLRVLIVVPKIPLLEQWERLVRQAPGLRERDIGVIGGRTPKLQLQERVVLSVINSARRALPTLIRHWKATGRKILLVVDECHGSTTVANREIFREPVDFTLGLSATPERGEPAVDALMETCIGPTVFRYPLRDALDDQILAPLRSVHIFFNLPAAERFEYEKMARRINELRQQRDTRHRRLQQPGLPPQRADPELARIDRQLSTVTAGRRRLLGGSRIRNDIIHAMAATGYFMNRRAILFHETIASAEETAQTLRLYGIRVALEHSQRRSEDREKAFRDFKSNWVNALVVVRTADEGIDVPSADTAVIVSGTVNIRQRIQRIGRILRNTGVGVTCFSLFARGTSEELEVARNDAGLLGPQRVEVREWNGNEIVKL